MDVSVCIAARNEQFLDRTIQDVLSHAEKDTEVIAVLDGYQPNPPLTPHPRLRLIHHETSIGQRAAVNEAARASSAKYVMKLDAHCLVDQGFDAKLMQPYESGEIGMDTTTIPRLYNLHCFSWQCKGCGNETYQGPKPQRCDKCKNVSDFEMVIVWRPRLSRRTDFARFDGELHFQYWKDYERRPESVGDICDVMSSVGACFFMPRERFWQLDGMDESHGSWGQMGTEVACKSWLSGGRQVVNKRTYYSHLFRTQPGFGFPYFLSQQASNKAREYSQDLWRNGKWPKAIHPLSWLVEKFAPVPGWEHVNASKQTEQKVSEARPKTIAKQKSQITKGIVYYTDNRLEDVLFTTVQRRIKASANGHKIVSVSLKPIEWGQNYTLDMERGYLAMFNQILLGLMNCEVDIIFLAEHDVLYSPSHFEFIPPEKDRFYYNENVWKVDAVTGQALFVYAKQTAQLCAYRELLLAHYRERVRRVEAEGFTRLMGFEPGTRHLPYGVDNFKAERWMSRYPNIDIRHAQNLTRSRWRKEEFRNQKYTEGWKLADYVPGWGVTKGRFNEFLEGVNGNCK